MCRWTENTRTAALEQPPRADGLEQQLDDCFNWFDAIDELPDAQMFMPVAQPSALQANASASTSSASASGSAEYKLEEAAGQQSSPTGPEPDLLELLRQQMTASEGNSVPQSMPMQPVVPMGFPVAQPVQFAAAAGVLGEQPTGAPHLPAAATMAGAMTMPGMQFPGAWMAVAPQALMQAPPVAPVAAPAPAPSRNGKSQMEIDEAIERIKKKRRESAQRSRARKNAYMRALELESKQLKEEVARLREALSKVAPSAAAAVPMTQVMTTAEALLLMAE